MPSSNAERYKNAVRVAASPAAGAIEASVLLAAMAYLDYAQWLSFSLTAVQPHPYWIPVVLAAVCHGRTVGLFLATCAAGIDGAFGWAEAAVQTDLHEFLAANARDPVLWLVAALFLGGIRERHAERQKQAEDARDKRTEEARILAERCRALMQEAAARERAAAASDASVAGSMLELFEMLIRAPGQSSLENFKETLHMMIGARNVAVYVPTSLGWIPLSGAAGWAASAVPSSVCEAVAARGSVLSCARSTDAALLAGHAAMAACVRGRDGHPVGVVFIGEVDPGCLTQAAEAAIAVSGFILGTRFLEAEVLQHQTRPPQQLPRLRVVSSGEASGA